MRTVVDCVPCFVRQAAEAVAFCIPDETKRTDIMRRVLGGLAQADWAGSPPATAQVLHRIIRKETGSADPYRAMKDRMNRLALELLPCIQEAARTQEDPLSALVRVSLAGNLLDAGAKTGLSESEVRTAVCRACRGDCMKGVAASLFQAAARATRVLFLTDNAGEIVFDRLLIEALPAGKMLVGVRGAPVLNDATLDDAEVAGLLKTFPVMANGSDAPGTVLDDCSPAFRKAFDENDLIIAKGQGNYESLQGLNKHIFFLLQVKCACVASHIGVPVGSMTICEHTGDGTPDRTVILQ